MIQDKKGQQSGRWDQELVHFIGRLGKAGSSADDSSIDESSSDSGKVVPTWINLALTSELFLFSNEHNYKKWHTSFKWWRTPSTSTFTWPTLNLVVYLPFRTLTQTLSPHLLSLTHPAVRVREQHLLILVWYVSYLPGPRKQNTVFACHIVPVHFFLAAMVFRVLWHLSTITISSQCIGKSKLKLHIQIFQKVSEALASEGSIIVRVSFGGSYPFPTDVNIQFPTPPVHQHWIYQHSVQDFITDLIDALAVDRLTWLRK